MRPRACAHAQTFASPQTLARRWWHMDRFGRQAFPSRFSSLEFRRCGCPTHVPSAHPRLDLLSVPETCKLGVFSGWGTELGQLVGWGASAARRPLNQWDAAIDASRGDDSENTPEVFLSPPASTSPSCPRWSPPVSPLPRLASFPAPLMFLLLPHQLFVPRPLSQGLLQRAGVRGTLVSSSGIWAFVCFINSFIEI